jgi:catechol 2,3-dioxygenase-like lactoylglutathione lyase family enzyme
MTEPLVERIDHLGLIVRDVEATCEFYQRVLGMQVVDDVLQRC